MRYLMKLSRRSCLSYLSSLFSLGLGTVGCGRRAVATKPLSLSFWHWHHPFALSNDTRETLKVMGVTELFVHCGTVRLGESDTAEMGKPYRVTPQQFQAGGSGFGVYLVYNAATNLLTQFEKVPMEEIVGVIKTAFEADKIAAEKIGAKVLGLQLDFDFPTRLLPRYAELLELIKTQFHQPTLSIAVLTTWYSSKAFSTILETVNFVVPQFYEGVLPHDYEHLVGITNPIHLQRGLQSAEQSAERSGKPFRAGLAAYGHALVFDSAGRLRGSFKDAGAEAILKDTNFRCLSAKPDPKNDEQFVTFTAAETVEKAPSLQPSTPEALNYRLVFDLPTVASLRRQLQFVRENRPANCEGIVLFRLPEVAETATLPLPTVQALWANEKLQIVPRLKISTRPAAPFRAIEDPTHQPATDVFISLINDGNAPTRLSPESVILEVRLAEPGIESVSGGGFLPPIALLNGQNASLTRADTLRCVAPSLAPRQTRTLGPIRLIHRENEKPCPLIISWEIHSETKMITGKMEYPTPTQKM